MGGNTVCVSIAAVAIIMAATNDGEARALQRLATNDAKFRTLGPAAAQRSMFATLKANDVTMHDTLLYHLLPPSFYAHIR